MFVEQSQTGKGCFDQSTDLSKFLFVEELFGSQNKHVTTEPASL